MQLVDERRRRVEHVNDARILLVNLAADIHTWCGCNPQNNSNSQPGQIGYAQSPHGVAADFIFEQ